MLPIPSEYMGSESGKISIRFSNGTDVVDGFMVKQTGARRYVVSDGSNEYTVQLVHTLDEALNLQPGQATILCYPRQNGVVSSTPEHIKTLERFLCYTVEDHHYGWRDANSAYQDGQANIALVP